VVHFRFGPSKLSRNAAGQGRRTPDPSDEVDMSELVDMPRLCAPCCWCDQGIGAGPIEAAGDAGRKANLVDADGNVISAIQVTPSS
jgi:hypothetical protein